MSGPNRSFPLVGLCLLALILALTACAAGQKTGRSDWVYYAGNKTSESIAGIAGSQLFREQVLFAALSASAYDYDLVRNHDGSVASIRRAPVSTTLADYFAHEESTYLPPFLREETAAFGVYDPPAQGWDIGGLGYTVFVETKERKPRRAIVVFRGTDMTEIGDWDSNLHWITRHFKYINDQYDQVQRVLARVVGRLRKQYGDDLELYTAGHSLGGGLAQFAAYGTCSVHGEAQGVARVHAFDPSPVTGFYSWPDWVTRNCAKNLAIYRIYDRGEVLGGLRRVLAAFYPVAQKDPKIVEVAYDLLTGSAVQQHSMRALAKRLWEQLPPQARDEELLEP